MGDLEFENFWFAQTSDNDDAVKITGRPIRLVNA